LNQWRNTKQVIEWFGNIKDKFMFYFVRHRWFLPIHFWKTFGPSFTGDLVFVF
jgi:hypothetical protein